MSVGLFSGTGYQTALASCGNDPTIADGNNATGPDQTGAVDAETAYTAIYDAGADVTYTAATAVIYYEGVPSAAWEYSSNGMAWTGLAGSSMLDNGGVFGSGGSDVVSGLPVTARYLRFSVKDSASGGNTARVSIREVIPSYTGLPIVYSDSPLVKIGANLSSSEADVLVDAPAVKIGARPGGADELIYAGGGHEYGERPRVGLGARPGGADLWIAVERAQANLALGLRESDEQRNVGIPTLFYEAVFIRLAAQVSMDGVEIGAGMDGVRLGLGARPGGASALVTADAATSRLGVLARGIDQQIWAATGQVNLGAKPGVSDQSVGKDAITAAVGAKPVYSGSVVGLDNVAMRLGAVAGGSDVVVDVEARAVGLGAAPVYSGSVVTVDATALKAGLKPAMADSATLAEAPKSALGAKPASAENRGYIETPMVRAGLRVGGGEVLVGVE